MMRKSAKNAGVGRAVAQLVGQFWQSSSLGDRRGDQLG
jgi:hypothetical protein